MRRFANSPKEILLLHELEKLLEYATPETFPPLLRALLPTLVHCVGSENNRVAERALQLWQNEHFAALTCAPATLAVLLPAIFPALMKEKHWNKTVNKMRGA